MVTVLRTAMLLFLCAVVLRPPEAVSCMVQPLSPVYTDEKMPADEQAFLRGNLGIIGPNFRRYYLAIAYRVLSGLPPTGGARTSKPAVDGDGERPFAPPEWEQARALVPGAKSIGYIGAYRSNPETHDYYLNCYDDAFRTAAGTLAARVQKYGGTSDVVRQWLEAQDMVFGDCGGGSTIPEPLPASADALARADRNYQIASAHFYSAQLDTARQEFTAIGNDRSSPWRAMGPYLAARCSIRSGAFADAEQRLKDIIADPAQASMHDRAQRLLGYVETKSHPAERMTELAHEILAPHPKDFEQTLLDYTWLYNTFENDGALNQLAPKDELAEWIYTFQSGTPEQMLAGWEAKHSTPWLMAALASTRDEPGLIAAADKLSPTDPGYLSAQYYAAVRLENAGKTDEARERLTRLLAGAWPQSARNRLLAARMKIARTWDEFLHDAQRVAAGDAGFDYSRSKTTADLHSPGFDVDGAIILNSDVPLDMLAGAAKDERLPESIRRNLAIVAWTRAIVLDRTETALDLTPVVATLVPGMAKDLAVFEHATDDDRSFAAAWTLLHFPGLQTWVEPGYGRLTPMNRMDSFHDNWWCAGGKRPGPLPDTEPPATSMFLTPDQKGFAMGDAQALAKVANGPDFLADRTLRWAKAHPDDPRLPEALHLVVRAGHLGCTGEQTTQLSKRAFELLHRRYPQSEWARKTPYYY